MYLKFENEFVDYDFSFLEDLFSLLDKRLAEIDKSITACHDPDAFGLIDDAEYLAGMGFVACLRYLTSTFGPIGISKNAALNLGPQHSGGETIARILNAAANYWKHHDEWDTDATASRDTNGLNSKQQMTIQVIETVTKWSDYTCFNLLDLITDPQESRFQNVLPKLEEWRFSLDSNRVG